MKTYSLEELTDKYIGSLETLKRKKFDDKLILALSKQTESKPGKRVITK